MGIYACSGCGKVFSTLKARRGHLNGAARNPAHGWRPAKPVEAPRTRHGPLGWFRDPSGLYVGLGADKRPWVAFPQ